MFEEKKIRICGIIIIILAIIVIIIFGIGIAINSKGEEKNNTDNAIDKENLKIQFRQPFQSTENEYVETLYNIEDSEVGKYDIKAHIPRIKSISNDAVNINNTINNTFVDSILNNAKSAKQYSTYDIEYTSFVNNNILSLVIRATIKQGANPTRIIIETYNFDVEQNRRVSLLEIIDEEQKEELQSEIKNVIQEENAKSQKVIEQGYSAYVRDEQDSMYNIENVTEFFIGNDNILYIIYAYGNHNYTDTYDLIIHKLK